MATTRLRPSSEVESDWLLESVDAATVLEL